MKMIVWKAPALFAPLLRRLFANHGKSTEKDRRPRKHTRKHAHTHVR